MISKIFVFFFLFYKIIWIAPTKGIRGRVLIDILD